MKESSKKIMNAFDEKAFIPFIMLADPNFKGTITIAKTFANNGANIIELGLPAKEAPLDGPSVVSAHQRALINNLSNDEIFKLIGEIKSNLDIPILIMAYMAALKEYGFKEIITKLADLDVDGIIVPDLSYNDMNEYGQIIDSSPLSFVMVVNPAMDDKQIEYLVNITEGFLYVAAGAKTGKTSNSLDEIASLIQITKAKRDIPTAIGFGIKTPSDAKEKSEISDGVIIGSAIVDIIGEHGTNNLQYLEQFAKEIVISIR